MDPWETLSEERKEEFEKYVKENALTLHSKDGIVYDDLYKIKGSHTYTTLWGVKNTLKEKFMTEAEHYNFSEERRDKIERSLFNVAEKISYTEYCKTNGHCVVCMNDNYYNDQDELVEYIYEEYGHESDKYPKYAWSCTAEQISILNAEDIVEMACEEMYDDAYDDVRGIDNLQAAIDDFLSENCDVISYHENHKVAVTLDELPGLVNSYYPVGSLSLNGNLDCNCNVCEQHIKDRSKLIRDRLIAGVDPNKTELYERPYVLDKKPRYTGKIDYQKIFNEAKLEDEK